MSISLRVVLVASALVVLLFMVRKIKKSQMKAMDAFFWLIFSLSFVLLAAFPQIAGYLACLLGFQASSNFIFRDFVSTIRYAQLRDRFDALVEEVALDSSEKR